MGRAMTWNQLRESNYQINDYLIEIDDGEYTCTLDFKAWGKKPCLNYFFTTACGKKIMVTGYPNYKYSPKGSLLDMSSEDITEGMQFKIVIGRSRSGKASWIGVEMLGD